VQAPGQESAQPRELDLALLQQAADGPQKAGWEKLTQLLHQAIQHRCDQVTIEPDADCWRIRFRADDINIEQIETELTQLQQLSDNLSVESQSILARVDQQRYLVEIIDIPCVEGSMYTLTLEPWQPLPHSLNDLQLPSAIDRRIRHWLSSQGGWLAVAGPSSRLNSRGQLALLQALSRCGLAASPWRSF